MISKPSDLSGIVLDTDEEKMIDIRLPQVDVERVVTYKGNEIEHRKDSYGELMLLGDIHGGHEDHTPNPFNAHLQFIYDRPHMRVGLMGDYIEYAEKTPFIHANKLTVDEEIEMVIRKLKPISKRIDFLLWGNHEERLVKHTDSKIWMDWFSSQIGVSDKCYIGEPQRGVFVTIHSKSQKYGMYALHGSSGAIQNKFSQAQKAMNNNGVGHNG